MSVMYALFDAKTLEGPFDHSGAQEVVELETDVVGLKTFNGGWVSQVPGKHGHFAEVHTETPGQAERFAAAGGGQLVTICLDPSNAKGHTYPYVLLALAN